MKTQLQIAFLLLIFTVAASAQQINPVTGLPDNGSTSPRIDPATGLPESGSPQSDLSDEWQKAKALMNQGQYEDSLEAFKDYFERSRFNQSGAGSRLFSIMDWVALGRRYPRAKQALIELRDTDSQKLLNGAGDFIYFGEVTVIDQDLGNGETNTYTLFKAIEQRDPHLARYCYPFVEDELAQKGEYETCRKYMGDPESSFQGDYRLYHMEMENQVRMAEIRQETMERMQEFYRQHPNLPAYTLPDHPLPFEKMSKDHFVGKVRELVEILVGTGDTADAQKIQKEALAVLDDPRLETAVDDAKAKVAKTP